MTAPYRLYGGDLSAYSIKVRSFLRYKGVPHEWLPRTRARAEEVSQVARLPLLPVLVTADGEALQDTTPMLQRLEEAHPEPPAAPSDPALGFTAALIEDYADEWLHKILFHFRWSGAADRAAAARRLVDMLCEGEPPEQTDREALAAQIEGRMSARLPFVGSSEANHPVFERSLRRAAALIEAHLASRPYLLGAQPTVADFALGAQLGQLFSDPTAGAILRADTPGLIAYVARMDAPAAEGALEPLETLQPTLGPFLEEEVAGRFLVWMEANAAAARANDDAPSAIDLDGATLQQTPQRYAAKAFIEIRRRRAMVAEDTALAALMEATGCDRILAPPSLPEPKPAAAEPASQDEEHAPAAEITADAAEPPPLPEDGAPPPLAEPADDPEAR